jgi:hypothetical protein
MLGSRINATMLIAARTVDHRLEPKRRYLPERREGQPMQFAAAFRLYHDQAPMLGPDPCPRGSPNGFHAACRIDFLPSELAHLRPTKLRISRVADGVPKFLQSLNWRT